MIWDWQTRVYRDSDSCGVCRRRFRANQTLDLIPLTDLRDEGEIICADVHEKCAAAYRGEERKRDAQIKELQDEITYLDYYASRAYGRATKGSITHDALHRQRRLRRQLLELLQGPGWRDEQWKALKRKYHRRCLGCWKKAPLEPDHIEPIEKGGAHHISNIQPLCKPCNMRKGARYYDYRPTDVRQWWGKIRERERLTNV